MMLRNPEAVMTATQMQVLERMYEATKTSKGEKGDTPVKGVDYFTPEEIDEIVAYIEGRIRVPEDGTDGRAGQDGVDGRHGQDGAPGASGRDGKAGKDGKSPLPSEIVPHVLTALKGSKIPASQVEGMPEPKDLASLVEFLKRGGYRGGGSSTGGTTVNSTYNEVVAGSGTAFNLAVTPTAGTVRLFGRGQRLTPTDGILPKDYAISGASITTTDTWSTKDITADYNHT